MKTGILIGLMMAAFSTSGAWAEGDQQTRMKTCNADAKKQTLAGDARKTFMKTCFHIWFLYLVGWGSQCGGLAE